MSFLLGAIAGGLAGTHWKGGGKLYGAVIGGVAGMALDSLTPDVDREKGVMGNAIGGAAAGAISSLAFSAASVAMFPGGSLSKMARSFWSGVAEPWLAAGPVGGRRRAYLEHGFRPFMDRFQKRYSAHFGPGGLGIQSYMTDPDLPSVAKYYMGTPEIARAVQSSGKMMSDMNPSVLVEAARRDAVPAAVYGSVIGAGMGTMFGMYHSQNRQERRDLGMYASTGIGSNRAYNRIGG